MIHRLTPQFILDKWSAGEENGRFPAVTLFIDLSGFTTLCAQMQRYDKAGAEQLADIMHHLFTPLVTSIYTYGGFIAGFAGDAFKAIFPDVTSQSHLAALAAAEEMRQHMLSNQQIVTLFGTFPFSTRISLSSGDVTWQIWTAENGKLDTQSQAYTFAGPALDAAIEGELYAEAGTIVLTEAVYVALQDSIKLTAVPLTDEAKDYFAITSISSPLPQTLIPTPQPPTINPAASSFYPAALLTQRSPGEFRHVVSLFLNANPSNRADQPFMQTFFRLLRQYDGYLCRIGRGGANEEGRTFLLFWGAPTAHENDIERALNFVLDLQAETAVPLRAGLTYQMVYAGFIGGPLREEYTCYGLHVNLAVRLMVAANWGEVWLDETIAERAQNDFQLAFVDKRPFKGFANPLAVYHLEGIKQRTTTNIYTTAIVGREAEMGQLETAVQTIFNGHFGGMITVAGEAGIGKSRLVHALLEKETIIQQAQVFLCQTDEILRETLNPFRYFLHHYFQQKSSASENDNKEQFSQRLDSLIEGTADPLIQAELTRTRSVLGALLGLHWPGSLYESLEPSFRQENSFTALKNLLKAETLRRPVILQLEDVHWLDDASRLFLVELTRNVETFPFVIIATTRDAHALMLPESVPQQTVPLDALPLAEVGTLATSLLQTAVSPSLVTLLNERTDGNPFFVEQLALYLAEQRLLDESPAGLTPKTAVLSLPQDLQAILIARIDRLTQEVRHVVQTAAVLGREFDVQILSEILREETAVSEKVKTAESAAIWQALSKLRYLFKHALLRDAAYDMQLQAQRRDLHHLAATAIETVYAIDLASHYVDLAFHYRQADQPKKERHYATQAGEQAAARFANSQALTLFDRALLLTPKDQLPERFRLLLAREAVYNIVGNREAQAQELATLHELADALNDTEKKTAVLLRETAYNEAIGKFAEGAAVAKTAVDQSAPASADRAQAYLHWGLALTRLGQSQAAQTQLQQAIEAAQMAAATRLEALSLRYYGIAEYNLSHYTEARDCFRRSYELMEQIGDLAGQASALNNWGATLSRQGHMAQGIPHLEQALQIRQQLGARRAEGATRLNLGGLFQQQGEYDRSQKYLLEALQLKKETGDRMAVGDVYHNLGVNATHLGQPELALTYFQTSAQVKQEIGAKKEYANSQINIGWLTIEKGDVEAGWQILTTNLEQLRQLNDKSSEALTLTLLGRYLLQQKQFSEAETYFQQALELRETIAEPHKLANAYANFVELALAQQDAAQLRQHLTRALSHLDNYRLEQFSDPFRFARACIQALFWLQEESDATALLKNTHTLLLARAAKIQDEAMRHSFLHNVPHNHDLLRLYHEKF
ncbi:MAG: tetratricopeptide repeat protein [Chloroflexota bacterium]